MLGSAHEIARWGSYVAPLANRIARSGLARGLNEKLFGIDRRRRLPEWRSRTLSRLAGRRNSGTPDVILFNDTFTNYYDPEIGTAALGVLEAAGLAVGVTSGVCCGRPLISKGLLARARLRAKQTAEALIRHAGSGRKIVFCEPSCLSAVKEDAPSLLRGDDQRKARQVAEACVSFEEFVASRDVQLSFRPGPAKILLHGHCHQKSMGLLPVIKGLLMRIPGAAVIDPDAGCCGMAGSFGYDVKHYETSRQIGERRLFPAVRNRTEDTLIVAPGFSCRHQIRDFTGATAIHSATLLKTVLAART
jgi:Fe-S oxidoreductase